jgi:sirohydrochlorin cobaltochelatase
MPDAVERSLQAALTAGSFYLGQIVIWPAEGGGFVLSHRDDRDRSDLSIARQAEDAIKIAKLDDRGNYRPLKTAPNLRHGWRLELATFNALTRALDYFYPGRLAVFAVWKEEQLQTTTLRETLARQSGMYRVAAKVSDEQIDSVVGGFCRSDGGCLRTILWQRDGTGSRASNRLPKEKFDPVCDQGQTGRLRSESKASGAATVIPLLCQEACNLLVAECRKLVKGEEMREL